MITSEGWVLINSEGKFAREYTINTHGGTVNKIEWVTDINCSSVFINKTVAIREYMKEAVAVVMAETTRTVRLKGGAE